LNNYNVTDIAFTINHPGQVGSATIPFGGTWNANWNPTSGSYIKAEDVVFDLNQLVISGFMFVPDLFCTGTDLLALATNDGADLSLFGCS
jgi:hypothetical protein